MNQLLFSLLPAFRSTNSMIYGSGYYAPVNEFKFASDGQSAKRIEIGKIRNTTGTIIEISALAAAPKTLIR
jgi:hypothetical protein